MQLFVNVTQAVKLEGILSSATTEKLLLPMVEADIDFNIKKTFPLLQTPLFNKLIGHSLPAAYGIFEKLNDLIHTQAQYVYTDTLGFNCLLSETFAEVKGKESSPQKLDRYPLPELWREFYRKHIGDFPTMLQLIFALSTHWGGGQRYTVYQFMDKEFMPDIKRFYGFELSGLKAALNKLPYINTLSGIMQVLAVTYYDASYANSVAENILASFLPMLGKGNARKVFSNETFRSSGARTVFIYQHNCISYWLSETFGGKLSKRAFTEYFMLRYQYYLQSEYLLTEPAAAIPKGPLSIFDFGHAYALGLIPESEVMQELLMRTNAEESLALASALLYDSLKPWQRNKLKAYANDDFALLKEVVKKVSEHILAVEMKRGFEPTNVSHLALKLERIEGALTWIRLLKSPYAATLVRLDNYYSGSLTPQEVFARLIRNCYPGPEDSARSLLALAKESGLSSERLMEAAVYAPQWLDLVEEAIGWKGLKSAVCFFHAHLNPFDDKYTRAMICHFTPVSRSELMGAFDLRWFRTVWRDNGAKRFDKICEAAKSIASTADHHRLCRYIDAANGKADVQEIKKQIEDKRNRDLLMIYCLLPLNRRTSDLTERYQYLQQFLKESKAFGSQRQENEKKAVEQGMLNLAFNAGYPDAMHLVWYMESALFKRIEPYFHPVEKEGVKVCIKAGPQGKTALHYAKAGKELNNVPAKLRKEPYVLRLKEVNKQLRHLFAGSERMLERAMEESHVFRLSELKAFRKNPLLWPLIKRVVFITGNEQAGFYTDEGLLSVDGQLAELESSSELRPAHPLDLFRLQSLSAYQTYVSEKGIEQAFEQVHRPFYQPTPDEQPLTSLLRQAGERIRPECLNELQQERSWIVLDDETLQKVYYKEDVVVHIHLRSHALSPSDSPSFTLERVCFFTRKSHLPLPLSSVSALVFSEVVREISRIKD